MGAASGANLATGLPAGSGSLSRLLLIGPAPQGLAGQLASFQVIHAPSLPEAKRRCIVETFDAALLSGGDPAGLEALRTLTPHLGGAPLLLLSPPEHEDLAHQAVQHGIAQDYLVLGHLGDGLIEKAVRYAVSRRLMLADLKERRRDSPALGVDRLTDLPNRALFFDRLGDALQLARQNSQMTAVLILGLEGFRLVHTTLGAAVGDPLLREISVRLRAGLAPFLDAQDFVARLSGDEFAVVLGSPAGMDDVSRAAEAALAVFADPFVLQGLEFFISCTAGISLYPFDGGDAESMLHNADLALRRAREQGSGGYQYFLPAVNDRFLTRLELQNSLRLGLARDEFIVHYMPQLDLKSGRVTSFEALVRWRHPTLGLVPPDDFIPLAEESGLILPIGERVLRAACAQSRAWRRAGLPPVRVSVNFSTRQFQHQNPVQLVGRVLRETGLEPGGLELEITESAVMKDADAALATLKALKETGVHLSIDDFGTGYSSLSYLRSFPIDGLKVDRSFVKDVAVRPEDQAIVSAVIALGHSLRLKVIAEGVEGGGPLEWLRSRNCDEAQGYHISRPVPPERAAALLSRSW